MLNRHHGQLLDGGLCIRVHGTATAERPVVVNGIPAERNGIEFQAQVVLREPETNVVAELAEASQTRDVVRVVWDRNSRPRYRFTVDDNSFFLRDIWQNRYDSLFDCFYLAMFRDLHEKYRTKFVLNISSCMKASWASPSKTPDWLGPRPR